MDLTSIKTEVICIQETTLKNQTKFNFKYYSGLFKEGQTNCRAYGGVANFIHKTITYQKITLEAPPQTLAARNNLGTDVTIVSIYNTLSHDESEKLLSTLFQQLPEPVVLTGDFNSYHQIWRNPLNDNRRCQVSYFVNKNQPNILNDRRHTITSGTSESAVDLTITSPIYSSSYPGMLKTVL